MTARLKDKVAIVMGAGSIGPGWGNGKAAAVVFAREGARVVCVDQNLDAARETVACISEDGGVGLAVEADVACAADVARVVATCTETYAGLDILHNNVGIVRAGGVVDLPEDQWDLAFDVNVKSCYLAMKFAIPVMKERGRGSIINISSIASVAYTGVDYCSYAATKSAMNHLTRVTAAQYAPFNVRVNAILPGLMRTPMVERSGLADQYAGGDVEAMWRERDRQVPMGRAGDAWDVANAALFLASDESSYVTGTEIIVDGGLTLACYRRP